MIRHHRLFFFFFFNDTATTEIYTLSLHDALPIWQFHKDDNVVNSTPVIDRCLPLLASFETPNPSDRKSTRLNSSHSQISYAVFCLKKKKKNTQQQPSDRVTHRTVHYTPLTVSTHH